MLAVLSLAGAAYWLGYTAQNVSEKVSVRVVGKGLLTDFVANRASCGNAFLTRPLRGPISRTYGMEQAVVYSRGANVNFS